MPFTINTLTNVPEEEVAEVTEDFESEGAAVMKRRDADGTWSVTGIYDGEFQRQGESGDD